MTSINPIVGIAAQRILRQNQVNAAASMVRLASSQRINTAADDPSGMVSSESIKAALASIQAEMRAMERAGAVTGTADAAVSEMSGMLAEAEALAVANANSGGMSDAEREAVQLQIDSLTGAVDRIARTSSFNGQSLFDGSASVTIDDATLDLAQITPSTLGQTDAGGTTVALADVRSGGTADSRTNPAAAARVLGAARAQLSTLRGEIGAFQANTIDTKQASAEVAFENVSAAHSLLRDTDYSAETARLARAQTLTASSAAVSALANAQAKHAVTLLG